MDSNTSALQKEQVQKTEASQELARKMIEFTEQQILSGKMQPGMFEALNNYYAQLGTQENRDYRNTELSFLKGRTNATNTVADAKAKRLSKNGVVDIRFAKPVQSKDGRRSDADNPATINVKENMHG